MSLVKAANTSSPATQSFEFTRVLHKAPSEAESKPIEAKAAVNAAPAKDKSLAKEAHFLDRIAALEKALGEKDKAIEAAKATSYQEGLKAGKKEAETKTDEALKLLEGSLKQGSKVLHEKLDGQVELSLDLARTILRRVLGDAFQMPAHVLSTAQHWKQELAEGSILRIRVSADDFTDQSSLDSLQAEFANVEIVPQLDLKPGACLFDLKLGTLDASIDGQLEKAEAFLLQAATNAEAE